MEIRKFAQDKVLPPPVEPPNQSSSTEEPSEVKGVMTPMKLGEKSVMILTERIKDEYGAHYYYRSAANYCKGVNYKKAAQFFEKEANSELDHAKKLQEYLDDWNIKPVIGQVETNHEFSSLVDIINGAYKMEFGLMESYNKDSSELFTQDLTTFDFLQDFRKLQKEAVIEYSDLLNALVLVDSTDKFQLLYFEQTYF